MNTLISGSSCNIFIVIPVYNESQVIIEVISGLSELGYKNIIVVDDGSYDNTFERILEEDVIALRHKINRGKGAAVKTGVAAANLLGAELVVTMDGDGQHDPADLLALTQPILEDQYDVVLGTRLIATEGMPIIKVIANKIGNFVTWILCGLHVADSQSGFRAYSKHAAHVIDTRADKYEYDSKVLREIKNNRLRYTEVPIEVRYTEYSMNKPHKQGFINGLKTLGRMIWSTLV